MMIHIEGTHPWCNPDNRLPDSAVLSETGGKISSSYYRCTITFIIAFIPSLAVLKVLAPHLLSDPQNWYQMQSYYLGLWNKAEMSFPALQFTSSDSYSLHNMIAVQLQMHWMLNYQSLKARSYLSSMIETKIRLGLFFFKHVSHFLSPEKYQYTHFYMSLLKPFIHV